MKVPPPRRRERIEQLRAAVEDGTYQVDAGELARKIVDKHIDPRQPPAKKSEESRD